MAVDYQPFPIVTDPDELLQLFYDRMAELVPGWNPYEGQAEARLGGATAFVAAVVADLAADVPPAIFRQFGTKLVGIPSEDPASASVDSTWTMKDDAGYVIAAGTTVGIPAGGDRLVAFAVAADVTVPVGATVTDTGGVLLVATEPGADGSGLGGLGTVVEAIDAYRYVADSGIVLTAVTTGGVDGETDEAYQDRLADRLRLLADRPILARDFADLVQDAIPEIDRAVAIDNYIPDPEEFDAERAVAIAAIDAQGLAVSSGVKTAAKDYLEARREQNFVVSVIDPTYTTVDVAFTAVAVEGYDPADVESRAEQAVSDYLSPARWGLPSYGNRRTWTNKTVVRYGEVWSEIDRVDGLDYLTALTVEGGVVNVTLAGVAPLPEPGTIAGTVTAP